MSDEQAKAELQEAWKKVKELEIAGVEFGRLCCKWRDAYLCKPKDKGDRIRFMWKSLGIPHTAAYYYMALYEGTPPKADVERYTAEELKRSELREMNENRLNKLFRGCNFPFYVKQNCATNEPHFNVVFSALTEKQVRNLANKLK